MAIQPVTTTRQWYSYGNVPHTPTSADDTQKWFLWLWKELLIGNYSGKGGTVGPEGARPATSYWSVVQSCDGAGNVASSDLWDTRAKVILGNYNANHSWIVLKSTETGPNAGNGFGQGPMYMLIDNSSVSGTAVTGRAVIMYSREPFTGGTATTRPTSPKEFAGAEYVTPAVATAIWTNTTYGVLRYMSISVDATGQFYMCTAVPGTATMESVSCLVENINSDDRDFYKQHAITCHFGHPAAIGSRIWDGSTKRTVYLSSTTLNSCSSGGLVYWGFGAGATSASTVDINNVQMGYPIYGPTVPQAGANNFAFGVIQNIDSDGYVIALPLYVLDYGAGYYGNTVNITNNRPQWRGQLPDSWAIASPAATGASYPNSGQQTHVVIPNQIYSKFLIPMSVQLAL